MDHNHLIFHLFQFIRYENVEKFNCCEFEIYFGALTSRPASRRSFFLICLTYNHEPENCLLKIFLTKRQTLSYYTESRTRA